MSTPLIFPLDPTGVSPTNKVIETYSITQTLGDQYYQFKFKNGPIFDNVILTHIPTNRILTPNVDYQLTYLFKLATNRYLSESNNKEIYSACVILNKKLSGTIKAEIQYLGGDFSSLNSNWIPEAVNQTPDNATMYYDDIVNLPTEFPVTSHKVHTSELTTGFDDVTTALWAINDSILKLSPVGKFEIDDIIGLREELDYKVDYRYSGKVLLACKGLFEENDLDSQIQIVLPKPYDTRELLAVSIQVNTGYDSYRLNVGGIVNKVNTTKQQWEYNNVVLEGTNTDYSIYCAYTTLGHPVIYISKRTIGKTLVTVTDFQTTSSRPDLMIDDFFINFTDDNLTGYTASATHRDNNHTHQELEDLINDVNTRLTAHENADDPHPNYWHNDETASKAQAEAGSSNGVVMTALRSTEHFLARLSSSYGDSKVIAASQWLVKQVKTELDNLINSSDPFSQYWRKDKTASKVQAEAGTDNTVVVTALRSREGLLARISDSLTSGRSDYALSEKAGKTINDSVVSHLSANNPHPQYWHNDEVASQAQAEAGSSNGVILTALRGMQQLKSRISQSYNLARTDYSVSESAISGLKNSIDNDISNINQNINDLDNELSAEIAKKLTWVKIGSGSCSIPVINSTSGVYAGSIDTGINITARNHYTGIYKTLIKSPGSVSGSTSTGWGAYTIVKQITRWYGPHTIIIDVYTFGNGQTSGGDKPYTSWELWELR